MFIAVAFLVAVPVSYTVMKDWLQGFAYHVSLGWSVFVVPGLLIVVITLLLVGCESLQNGPYESFRVFEI